MKKENKLSRKKVYISPDIDVVHIEIEQSILAAGSGTTNNAPDMAPEYW